MNKEELIKRIAETETQIKQFEKRMKNSDLCRSLYNNAILQRAVLKQELKDYGKNGLIENIKKHLPRKKKLICDYFNDQ